jgi:hypothetical protein
MQKIHLMMGGRAIKIFLAVPVPSILQLLLPDVVKEHLSRFPYGPGAEIKKTMWLWRTFIRIERQTHKAYFPLICRLSCVLFSKVGCLQVSSANRKKLLDLRTFCKCVTCDFGFALNK